MLHMEAQETRHSRPGDTFEDEASIGYNSYSDEYTTSSEPISRAQHNVFGQTIWQLALLICTTILFVVTAWFANSTFSLATLSVIDSRLTDALHIDVSSTLTLLRVLEAVLSLSASAIITNSFELLQWTLASRDTGFRALRSLGLSPTTSFLGTFELVFSKHAQIMDRVAASGRTLLFAAIWISGVILFVKTSLEIVYEPVLTYNVTAGVGRFNGSYIPEYLQRYENLNKGYDHTVLPHSTMIGASTLATNPLYSTSTEAVSCERGQVCQGFLLSGGLSMTTPWPPTNYSSSPMITIRDVPILQIDFVQGIHNDSFIDSTDCSSFGGPNYLIGIKFCLAKSRSSPGSLIAGIFVCTEGAQDDQCQTNPTPAQVTTTYSLYNRRASITTSRSNLTVISVDNLSEPVQDLEIDVNALNQAFTWLLNFTAADVPAPSSIAEYFWAARDQLESDYYSVEPYQIFHSLLSYPLFLFNPNNYGNVQLTSQDIVYTLPGEFYTTAAIANPYEKIAVDKPMFIVFCALQCTVTGFAWLVLIWLWIARPRMLKASSYPLFDFAVKTRFIVDDDTFIEATGNRAVRKALSTARVVPADMKWCNEIRNENNANTAAV